MASLTHTLSTGSTGAARGSAAPGVAFLARTRAAIWRTLEAIGEHRGRAVLLQHAREHEESRPEFAAQMRETARRGWL
jgi:hypothetical protein